MWTNASLPPSSGWMKPKPFCGLNHFTVPIAMTIPFGCEYSDATPTFGAAIMFRFFEGVHQNKRGFARSKCRPAEFRWLKLRRLAHFVNSCGYDGSPDAAPTLGSES